MTIQLATNLHNDYADFVKGADTESRVGQARATQKGWLSPFATAAGSSFCLLVSLLSGVTLLHRTKYLESPVGWAVILSSMFNAVAYTGGPYPLGYLGLQDVSIAYWGLGDIFVFLYFGQVATVMIPFLSLPDAYVWDAMLLACPVGWISTCIIIVNNLRDRHTDVLANKRTTAVRFGAGYCQVVYVLQMVLSYGMTALFAVHFGDTTKADGGIAWRMFLPLLSIPLAIPCIRAIFVLEGQPLNSYLGATARVELAYSVLLSVAMSMGERRDDVPGFRQEL